MNFKAMRYESTSFSSIVADKSHRVTPALMVSKNKAWNSMRESKTPGFDNIFTSFHLSALQGLCELDFEMGSVFSYFFFVPETTMIS